MALCICCVRLCVDWSWRNWGSFLAKDGEEKTFFDHVCFEVVTETRGEVEEVGEVVEFVLRR